MKPMVNVCLFIKDINYFHIIMIIFNDVSYNYNMSKLKFEPLCLWP
jgi:hypothetical protein